MLASAFLSTAVAFADTTDVITAPVISPGDELNLLGNATSLPYIELNNGEPPFFGDVIGLQEFDVYDTTAQGSSSTPVDVGTTVYEYDQWTAGGITSTEYTLDGFDNADPSVDFTNVPDPGSVYDTINFGNGLENVYSDVLTGPTTGETSTVTDGLYFDGNEILNLSPLVDALALNPADFVFPI
jgi:hypothetical protein